MNRLIGIAVTLAPWVVIGGVAWWLCACNTMEPTPPVCRQYSFSHDSGADTSWVIPCSDTAHVAGRDKE